MAIFSRFDLRISRHARLETRQAESFSDGCRWYKDPREALKGVFSLGKAAKEDPLFIKKLPAVRPGRYRVTSILTFTVSVRGKNL